MFYVVPLSEWTEDRHAKGRPVSTLQEGLAIASDGEDPDVLVDEDGHLACLAGEELGAGACGCPRCDSSPVRDAGWFRGFTTGRAEPNATDWQWLAEQPGAQHASAKDRAMFAAGMAEGAAVPEDP